MGDNKCSHPNCQFDIYEDKDECVLHCEKNHEHTYDKVKIYEGFTEALITYIAINLVKDNTEERYISKKDAIHILNGEEDSTSNKISNNDIVKGELINLSWIHFPFFQSSEYIKVLKILFSIEFDWCHFDIHTLELGETKCFFQDCTFYNTWSLSNTSLLDYDSNFYKVIYRKCHFIKDVSTLNRINEQLIINETPFSACQIENLFISNAFLKKMIFNDLLEFEEEVNGKEIKNIQISHSKIGKEFKLNNYKLKSFRCKNTIFKNDFEFNQNHIENFEIDKVTFKGLVNFKKTDFTFYTNNQSKFEKKTSFEKSIFKNKVVFENTTFLDFVNFRKTIFYNGLELENTDLIAERMNFLDIYVEPENTSRETFRIIKYSFDKVGNTIEANKFFADEMDKERKSEELIKFSSKWWALHLNYYISNFGQTFLIPLLWIFTVSMTHSMILSFLGKYELTTLNELVNNIIVFKKLLQGSEGKEFISLFFGVIYMVLIYNVIIAVKRIIKR